MSESNTATASTVINAPSTKVWAALTDPNLVRQYMFGTEVVSDWQVGSPLIYKGEWKGQTYEDKGTILEIEPNHILKATYFSSMSTLEDKPENYNIITYELTPESEGHTKLTVTQANNPSPESAAQSSENWKTILAGLKKIVEQ